MRPTRTVALATLGVALTSLVSLSPSTASGASSPPAQPSIRIPQSMPAYAEYEERELDYEQTAGPHVLKPATLSRYARKSVTWSSELDWREDILDASEDSGPRIGDWRDYVDGLERRIEHGVESTTRISPRGVESLYVPREEFAIPFYRGLRDRVANGEYENDDTPRPCGDDECGLVSARRPVDKPHSGEYFHSLPWASTNDEVEHIEYDLNSGLIRSRQLLFNGMVISSFELRCYTMLPSATNC